MMPCPYGNSMTVENGADVMRVSPLHDKRQDTYALFGIADQFILLGIVYFANVVYKR